MADVLSVTLEEFPGMIMKQRPVSVQSVTPGSRPGTGVDNDIHGDIRTGITRQVRKDRTAQARREWYD